MPPVKEVPALESEPKSKKGKKLKKASSSSSPGPERKEISKKKKQEVGGGAPQHPASLDFPASDSDSIYATISSAYSILKLIKVEGDQDGGEMDALKFWTRLPSVLGESSRVRLEGIPEDDHVDMNENVPWGNDPEKNWEFISDNSAMNLSIELTGGDKYKTLVPSVVEAGKSEVRLS